MTRVGLLTHRTIVLLLIAFLFFLFILVSYAFAHSTNSTTRENLKIEKLGAQKLKVCLTKERTISKRLESLTNFVANQEEKFTEASVRVQSRYTTKLVPDGKTLSNYDSLVEDIATKKDAVDTALADAKTNADSFSCQASDPKGLLTTFREDMQEVKKALHEYRKSIRNLIVAVAGLAGEKLNE